MFSGLCSPQPVHAEADAFSSSPYWKFEGFLDDFGRLGPLAADRTILRKIQG